MQMEKVYIEEEPQNCVQAPLSVSLSTTPNLLRRVSLQCAAVEMFTPTGVTASDSLLVEIKDPALPPRENIDDNWRFQMLF